MARLEDSIKNIVDMFVEYADGDGKLNKEELQKMMEKEIQSPELKAKMTAGDFEKAMGRMDKNRDGEIDFREFLKCFAFMTKCYYKKKTGKGQDDDE